MSITEMKADALAVVLAKRWQAAADKFIALAEALPDEKLEAELVAGARSCGAVLRHVAYWNRYVADSLNGRKADDSGNELPRENYQDTKAIVKELKSSSREIANGLQRPLEAESLGFIAMGFEHLSEHYGQLAVCARLLNITPPASRS